MKLIDRTDFVYDYITAIEKTRSGGYKETQGFVVWRKQIEDLPVIEAIPITWIKTYVLSTGKAVLPFNAMINEWRRINGQQ